jgi:hypothetical protein
MAHVALADAVVEPSCKQALPSILGRVFKAPKIVAHARTRNGRGGMGRARWPSKDGDLFVAGGLSGRITAMMSMQSL